MIYSIFLRGINTGGLKLMSDEFKQILSRSGCNNIKTIQAAGTAVFSYNDSDMNKIKAAVDHELSQFFGKKIAITLRTKQQIEQIIAEVQPIRSDIEFYDYIMLTDDDSLFAEIEQMHATMPYSQGERLINQERYFVWTIRKGSTLDDFGSKVLGSKKFRDRLTSRNINTIEKVAEGMAKIIEEALD